jgi:hypothetical protein
VPAPPLLLLPAIPSAMARLSVWTLMIFAEGACTGAPAVGDAAPSSSSSALPGACRGGGPPSWLSACATRVAPALEVWTWLFCSLLGVASSITTG